MALFAVVPAAQAAEQAEIDLDLESANQVYLGGQSSDRLGTVIAVGDLDGDGVDDIVVGAPHAENPVNGENRAGLAYIFFGPIASGTPEYDLNLIADRPAEEVTWIGGDDEEDWLGSAVAAGDITGDGIDDLIVSVPLSFGPDNDEIWRGEVLVFKGGAALRATRQLLPEESDFIIYGQQEYDRIGVGLVVGDLTGDGIVDLGVLSPFGDDTLKEDIANRLYLFFGGATFADGRSREISLTESRLLKEFDFDYLSSGNNNNLAVGDVNGDGVGDLLVGSPGADRDALGDDAGVVYTLLGSADLAASTDPIDFSIRDSYAARFLHTESREQLGQALAISPMQPDGVPWIAMTVPFGDYDDNILAGLVYVYEGGAWIDSATDVVVNEDDAKLIYGEDDRYSIGNAVTFGDFDGDGWSDLLIGCPFTEGPPRDDDQRKGRAYILLASTIRNATQPLNLETDFDLVVYGRREKDEFGYCVAAGSVLEESTADAADDIIVTAWLGDGPPENREGSRGEVYFLEDLREDVPVTKGDLNGDRVVDYKDALMLCLPAVNGLPRASMLLSDSEPLVLDFLRGWQSR